MRVRRWTRLVGWGGFVVVSALYFFGHYRLTWTGSMPEGLYGVAPLRRIERFDIVAFCPSRALGALSRGIIGGGTCRSGYMPLMKVVVGLPGDEVRIVGHVLTVNGVALKGCGRRIARDSTGRAVPRRRWGGGVIPAGDLFVCGLARRSWDSRYFGPVRRPRAIAVAWPLWTRDWGWGELNGWRKAYAEKGEPR